MKANENTKKKWTSPTKTKNPLRVDAVGSCGCVCTNQCKRKHHVKDTWIYVPKTKKVKKTYEDIKKKYKEGEKGVEKHSNTLERMQQEMDKLLEQEHEELEKSFQHITRLESIALKVDSIFTFKHLDFLIERMQDGKFAEERKAQAWFKYKNITETSQLIRSGSPKIYRLNAVTKITEGLKTVTVGTKKVNRLNKTILLLGETGTGKSTLIDLLVNYAMGVKWGDEVWFKIVEEETTRQSESQTSDVIMYQIFGFEGKTLPFSLTLVDTPGYGDNRDEINDDSIAERLLEWFTSDGVQSGSTQWVWC
ncbi:hypothetical protein D4764_20G0001920 [Takifugu flavidus]|uniref:Septin-type G domain-containing protein n=1 Tax=Takifugu flavidus TaxID=433684 RepID=A0A5C6NJB9_9TELE|nr:hypothetical protein D4764_20G0001920 [Takifugu flavidus]